MTTFVSLRPLDFPLCGERTLPVLGSSVRCHLLLTQSSVSQAGLSFLSPPLMQKATGIMRDPHMRKIRALMMMEFKIKNAATSDEIAKEFGVSRKTVERTLSFAKKAGLLVEIEDKILSELMPAAHKAILAGLADEDSPIEAAKIGLELLKSGVPMLKKTQGPAKADQGDELAAYIAQLRADDSEVVDAEQLLDASTDTLASLPAAAEAVTPQGDASPARGDADGPGALASEPANLGERVSEGS